MPASKIYKNTSAQYLAPVRVVLDERSMVPNRKTFIRSLQTVDGFRVEQRSGSIKDMLLECQAIAPCVLIACRESIEELGADEFRRSVGVDGSVRVLVLGNPDSPDVAEKCLAVGCMGYLSHGFSRLELQNAVHALASGEVWADRRALSRAFKILIARQLAQGLTGREQDVLRLITCGHTNRAIAARLCITHETVRWHIRSLYSKLGVGDRFGAVLYGKRLLGFQNTGEVSRTRSTSEARSSNGSATKIVNSEPNPVRVVPQSLEVSQERACQIVAARKREDIYKRTPMKSPKVEVPATSSQARWSKGLAATSQTLCVSSFLLFTEALNFVLDAALA